MVFSVEIFDCGCDFGLSSVSVLFQCLVHVEGHHPDMNEPIIAECGVQFHVCVV